MPRKLKISSKYSLVWRRSIGDRLTDAELVDELYAAINARPRPDIRTIILENPHKFLLQTDFWVSVVKGFKNKTLDPNNIKNLFI